MSPREACSMLGEENRPGGGISAWDDESRLGRGNPVLVQPR
jgi:hypothetical protein